MSKDRELPTVDRLCPKCNNNKANGPEYRRGINNDTDLGEHLRFYCTVCRFMSLEPTKDSDTSERRAELATAFAARATRTSWSKHANEPQEPSELRQRDIDSVRRGDASRRPYGWQR